MKDSQHLDAVINRTIVNLVLSEPGDANPTDLGKLGATRRQLNFLSPGSGVGKSV